MKVMGKCQHHERIEKKAWKVPVEKAMMGGSDKAMEKEDSCKLERVVAGSVAQSQKWAIKVSFHGWRCKKKQWKMWVESLHSSHHCVWRKAGISKPIMGSTYKIRRNDNLVYGIAAKWCPETNTFVFRGVKPPLCLRL